MTLADLSAVAWPGDPAPIEQVIDAYFDTIRYAITHDPRSLQVELGPSELGAECLRKIAYKLAGTQPVNTELVPWRSYVGRCVHEGLKEIFALANVGHHPVRWLVELELDVGELWRDGQLVTITGHSDLMALTGRAVLDHKVTGPTSLKKYRRNRHPGRQYREQAHLYGRGWTLRGLPVEHVGCVFLPMNGELAEAYVWHEPYDEQIALGALQRVQAVQSTVDALGDKAPALFPAVADHCAYCPFFRPDAPGMPVDLTLGCPGMDEPKEPPSPPSSLFGR